MRWGRIVLESICGTVPHVVFHAPLSIRAAPPDDETPVSNRLGAVAGSLCRDAPCSDIDRNVAFDGQRIRQHLMREHGAVWIGCKVALDGLTAMDHATRRVQIGAIRVETPDDGRVAPYSGRGKFAAGSLDFGPYL